MGNSGCLVLELSLFRAVQTVDLVGLPQTRAT